MTSVDLDVLMLPPSPNQLRGSHWSKKKKIRDEAAWAVKTAGRVVYGGTFGKALWPATLDVTICAHGVAGDPDNQWARIKPVIDALVTEGLLVDDSPRWLHLGSMTHEKAKPRQGHIRLRITYHQNEETA